MKFTDLFKTENGDLNIIGILGVLVLIGLMAIMYGPTESTNGLDTPIHSRR